MYNVIIFYKCPIIDNVNPGRYGQPPHGTFMDIHFVVSSVSDIS